jgi:uncharacterized protein YbjT (DUF2867 family)
MTRSGKIVLVTGATGRQGGAVISHMLPKGWKLRVLTRNQKVTKRNRWHARVWK